MSAKKITFASKRPSQSNAAMPSIDDWVGKTDAVVTPPPAPQEKMKRLTIDVPMSLHRKIKSTCALKNLHMADEIRDLLEDHFGGQNAGEGTSS